MFGYGEVSDIEPVPEAEVDEGLRRRRVARADRRIGETAAHINAAYAGLMAEIAEMDALRGWADQGATTLDEWVGWRIGVTPVEARNHVRVARKLVDLPNIFGAFRRGELSYWQIRAIAPVATPEVEGQLLDFARHSTAAHLQRIARAFKGCLDRAELELANERHAYRGLNYHFDDDGFLQIHGRLDAEQGAILVAALERAERQLRNDISHDDPDAPTCEQIRADALVEVVKSSLAEGPRPTAVIPGAVVHVDAASLIDGCGDICEVPNGPSNASETARRMTCDCSFQVYYESDGSLLDVGRTRRTVGPRMRKALEERDRGCVFPGCGRGRHLDAHHIVHWSTMARPSSSTSHWCADITTAWCMRADSRCTSNRTRRSPSSAPKAKRCLADRALATATLTLWSPNTTRNGSRSTSGPARRGGMERHLTSEIACMRSWQKEACWRSRIAAPRGSARTKLAVRQSKKAMGVDRYQKVLSTAGLLLLLACGLAASSPARAQETPTPVVGGKVVIAADQYPYSLQFWSVCCFLTWTDYMLDGIFPDAYSRAPDWTWVPEVLAEEAEVTEGPFTVTYRIRPEATWSDGHAVTAWDFVFTWRSFVDRNNYVFDRDGYSAIRDAGVLDSKTVRFTFRHPYSDYKELFQDVFPRHLLHDKNINRVWRNHIPVSAGPFMLSEFEPESHLTLVRNDNYWGEPALLDEVEFRFFNNLDDQLAALEAGEVDVIYPQADPKLPEVREWPGIEVQSSSSRVWEHVDIQHTDPRLSRRYIREAVATAIDRKAIVDELIVPIQPDAQVLQNMTISVNDPRYESHFDEFSGDPDAARAILEDHGCALDADGIYVCRGHLLHFIYYTTNLNPIRKQVAEMIHDQLDAAGIEVEVRRRSPGIVFGSNILVRGNYDLFQFAWVLGSPHEQRGIWVCDGGSNFSSYCSDDTNDVFNALIREVDQERVGELLNTADSIMAEDIAGLPLYQKPTFLAYDEDLEGLEDNPTDEGFTWNIEEWWLQPTS